MANESQRLLHRLSPEPEYAQMLGSQGLTLVDSDWQCTSPAAPTRQQATVEPNTGRPLTAAKTGQGRGWCCWAVTPKSWEALLVRGLRRERRRPHSSYRAGCTHRPHHCQGHPRQKTTFWSVCVPESMFLPSGPMFLSHPRTGFGSFLCPIGEFFLSPLPGTTLTSAPLSPTCPDVTRCSLGTAERLHRARHPCQAGLWTGLRVCQGRVG